MNEQRTYAQGVPSWAGTPGGGAGGNDRLFGRVTESLGDDITPVGPRADRGRIEVITGPMFAGKSEELMRRVRRATIAGLDVVVVHHALDIRHGASAVASHAGGRIPAQSAADAEDLRRLVAHRLGKPWDLVAVDEAQFFGEDLVPVVTDVADRGATVVVSGLCQTFDDQPFEPLPTLMASAEQVTKLLAVCSVCGADAAFHRRTAAGGASRNEGRQVAGGVRETPEGDVPEGAAAAVGNALVPTIDHVGGIGAYQARCRRHR